MMRKLNTRAGALLTLLFMSGAAYADQISSTFPVFWVAGDPTVIANVFQFVAAMFGNGNSGSSVMMGAMTCAGLVGLTCALISSAVRTQFMVGQWLAGTIIAMFMFIPTTTLTVMSFFDETSAMVSPRMQVIDHIPIGLAYPAGIASFASKAMSDKFMTWFGSGDNGATTTGASGLMNPLKILLRMETMYDCSNSGDYGMLCENYLAWIKNCPGLTTRMATTWTQDVGLNTLLNDNTIAGYTDYHTYLPPGATATTVNDNSQFTSDQITYIPCKQAGPLIYTAMTAYVDPSSSAAFNADIARGLPISAPDGPSTGNQLGDLTAAGEQGQSVLQQMQTALSGLTATNNDIGAAIVFHQMVAAGKAARAAGTSQHAAEQFTATMQQARLKAVTDQAIQGSMFVSFMVTAMNDFTFLFAGSAPLIILMAVVMGFGGFKIYGSWLMFGVWSQSWLPLATLVSYYTEYSFWQNLANLQYTGQLSQANIDNFFYQVSSAIYTGSTMMSAVPIITLSLLSGSMMAFSTLAGKATGTDRDYGDSSHMAGTDLAKSSNADAYEKTATAGGSVFSASAGPISGRLVEREIEGAAKWSGSNAVATAHSNLESAKHSEQLTNQEVHTAQTSLESATRAALSREAHTGTSAATKSSASDVDKTQKVMGKNQQFTENIVTKEGLNAKLGSNEGPVGVGGNVGTEVSQSGQTINKNEHSFGKETGLQNSAEKGAETGNSVRVSQDKAVVAARQRLESAQRAHQTAVAAEQTASDDVKRASEYKTGVDANVGKLARDSFASDRVGTVADAHSAARSAGGDAGFAKLDAAVEKFGGWNSEKAVTLGISSAMKSGDHDLHNAGLGAASAMASHAGQAVVAEGMQEDITVRNHQREIESSQSNATLGSMAHGGNLTSGAESLGVRRGAPAMPTAPSGSGVLGKSDPALGKQQHDSYGNPAYRSNPNHAQEVSQYDALEAMGKGSAATPEGQAILADAKKQDQQKYDETRNHLVTSTKVTK